MKDRKLHYASKQRGLLYIICIFCLKSGQQHLYKFAPKIKLNYLNDETVIVLLVKANYHHDDLKYRIRKPSSLKKAEVS